MTRKPAALWLVVAALVLAPGLALAKADETPAQTLEPAWKGAKQACTEIKSGAVLAPNGDVVVLGYDQWGYNYQAHLFNGLDCNHDRDGADCQPSDNVELSMKWNDAYLSNQDCDGDGFLDRHYGFASYQGSGAWLTNHYAGTYTYNGKTCRWSEVYKFVAAPADAHQADGMWYAADGTEIGQVVPFNPELAAILDVYNDPCGGYHGPYYHSPGPAGLGAW